MKMPKAVLLDRDGVINFDSPRYILSVADFTPIPGAIAAVAALKEAGIRVALLSNQSAVGRGWIDEERLAEIHAHLERLLRAQRAAFDFVGYCTHAPEEDCACRKPRPGLVHAALKALDVAPEDALMIGDSARDLEAAAAAGVPGWLVASGYKPFAEQLKRARAVQPALHTFVNLAHAVSALLSGNLR